MHRQLHLIQQPAWYGVYHEALRCQIKYSMEEIRIEYTTPHAQVHTHTNYANAYTHVYISNQNVLSQSVYIHSFTWKHTSSHMPVNNNNKYFNNNNNNDDDDDGSLYSPHIHTRT